MIAVATGCVGRVPGAPSEFDDCKRFGTVTRLLAIVVVLGGRSASKVRRTAMNEVTATFEITVSGIHPKTLSKPTHRNQSACNTNLRPGSGDIGTLSRCSIHDAMLWNNGAAD
ncbi:hypothetical protein rerp_33530 [Rhodococcus erythropolis]|nr:hypothetical protein rerp_33530 [Rhodococcus erythropolis]